MLQPVLINFIFDFLKGVFDALLIIIVHNYEVIIRESKLSHLLSEVLQFYADVRKVFQGFKESRGSSLTIIRISKGDAHYSIWTEKRILYGLTYLI